MMKKSDSEKWKLVTLWVIGLPLLTVASFSRDDFARARFSRVTNCPTKR